MINFFSNKPFENTKFASVLNCIRQEFKCLTSSFNDDKRISSFPNDTWASNVTIFGSNFDKILNIYSGVPLLNAYQKGGLFILNEAMANPIISKIESDLSLAEQSRLKVVYLSNGKYCLPKYAKHMSYNPLKTEKTSTIKRLLIDYMESSFDRTLDSWANAECRFIDALFSAFEICFGENIGHLEVNDIAELASLKALKKFVAGNGGLNRFDKLNKFLHSIYGFSVDGFLSDNLQSIVHEHYAYSTMRTFEKIKVMTDASEMNQGEPISLEKSLSSSDIVVAVYPDGYFLNYFATDAISSFKEFIFSESLKFKSSGDHESNKEMDFFKPVVIDNYSFFNIDDLPAVTDKAQNMGFSFYFGIGSVKANANAPKDQVALELSKSKVFIYADVEKRGNFLKSMVDSFSEQSEDEKLCIEIEINKHKNKSMETTCILLLNSCQGTRVKTVEI